MTINGRDYKFLLTVRARREVRALCPENKLEKLTEAFEDSEEGDEVMARLICILSKGYEDYTCYWEGQKGKSYVPQPITMELLETLTMEEFNKLATEAGNAYMRGMGITVETEPIKEKGKKKEKKTESSLTTPGSSSTDTN